MKADGFLAKAGVVINKKDDLIAMVGKVSNNLSGIRRLWRLFQVYIEKFPYSKSF